MDLFVCIYSYKAIDVNVYEIRSIRFVASATCPSTLRHNVSLCHRHEDILKERARSNPSEAPVDEEWDRSYNTKASRHVCAHIRQWTNDVTLLFFLFLVCRGILDSGKARWNELRHRGSWNMQVVVQLPADNSTGKRYTFLPSPRFSLYLALRTLRDRSLRFSSCSDSPRSFSSIESNNWNVRWIVKIFLQFRCFFSKIWIRRLFADAVKLLIITSGKNFVSCVRPRNMVARTVYKLTRVFNRLFTSIRIPSSHVKICSVNVWNKKKSIYEEP